MFFFANPLFMYCIGMCGQNWFDYPSQGANKEYVEKRAIKRTSEWLF